MALQIYRPNYRFHYRKRYVSLTIIALAMFVMLYRASVIYTNFKSICTSSIAIKEIKLHSLDGSETIGNAPYGLDIRMCLQDFKCPLHFEVRGLSLAVSTSSNPEAGGTNIKVSVDDLKFVKKSDFDFYARLKVQSFTVDRPLAELFTSKFYMSIKLNVRARFCLIPLYFSKNIERVIFAQNDPVNRSTGLGSVNEHFRHVYECVKIRLFEEYPVPCVQVGWRNTNGVPFRLEVGNIKLVLGGMIKLMVFVSSFDTANCADAAEVQRQYEREKNAYLRVCEGRAGSDHRSSFFHTSVPGETSDDGTVFYFVTIPLFQDMSLVKLLATANKLLLQKDFSIATISVLNSYQAVGLTEAIRRTIEHERRAYVKQLKDRLIIKKNKRKAVNKKEEFIRKESTDVFNAERAFLFKNPTRCYSLQKESNFIEQDIKKKIEINAAKINAVEINTANKQNLNKQNPNKQNLNKQNLVEKLLKNNKIMSLVKKKYNLLRWAFRESPFSQLPHKSLSIHTLKEALPLIFSVFPELPIESLDNHGFSTIPIFSGIRLLNLLFKQHPNTGTPPLAISITRVDIEKGSFTVLLSNASSVGFMQKLLNFKSVASLFRHLSFSFDISLGEQVARLVLSIPVGTTRSPTDPLELNFQLTELKPFTITLSNISTLKCSFFKLFHKERFVADIDLFDLFLDIPRSVYLCDRFNNKIVLHEFGKKKGWFAMQIEHIFEQLGECIKVTSKMDLSEFNQNLIELSQNKNKRVKETHKNVIFSVDVPSFNFSMTNPSIKLKADVHATRVQVYEGNEIEGVLEITSVGLVRKRWAATNTFLNSFMAETLRFSINEGAVRCEFSVDDFFKQFQEHCKQFNRSQEKQTSADFRMVPFSICVDHESWMPLQQPTLQLVHDFCKEDEIECFSLCCTEEFMHQHKIKKRGKESTLKKNKKRETNVFKKPTRWHVRNILHVKRLGMPLGMRTIPFGYITTDSASFVIDAGSEGGCFYFLKPVQLVCTLPTPTEAHEAAAFQKKSERECKLHEVMDFVFMLISEIFCENVFFKQPGEKVVNVYKKKEMPSVDLQIKQTAGQWNEQHKKEKIESKLEAEKELELEEVKNIFNAKICCELPKDLFIAIPCINFMPFVTVSVSNTSGFYAQISLENKDSLFALTAECSIPETVDQSNAFVSTVNGRVLNKFIFPFTNTKELFSVYFSFINAVLKSPLRKEKPVNLLSSKMKRVFSINGKELPADFFFENIFENKPGETVPSADSTDSKKAPELLTVQFDSVKGSENSVEIGMTFGIDALLKDIGEVVCGVLVQIPFMRIPAHVNLKINGENIFGVGFEKKEKKVFNITDITDSNIKDNTIISENDNIIIENNNQIEIKEINNKRNASFVNNSHVIAFEILNLSSENPLLLNLLPSEEITPSFLKTTLRISSACLFTAPCEIIKHFSSLQFIYQWPFNLFVDLLGKSREQTAVCLYEAPVLNEPLVKPSLWRLRTSINCLPCLYIDIRSPYMLRFVGDPLVLFLDAGITTKITLRFRDCFADPAVLAEGYLISFPVLFFQLKEPKINGNGSVLPLNEMPKQRFCRSFWIHRDTHFSHTHLFLIEEEYRIKNALSLVETVSRLRTRSNLLNGLLSKALNVLAMSIHKFMSLNRYFVISSDSASDRFNDVFGALTSEEKEAMVRCLMTAPQIEPQI